MNGMMNDGDFIDDVFEIAFGAGAADAEPPYPRSEVLAKLREYSDASIEQTTE